MTLNPIKAIEISLGINRPAAVLTIGGFVVMAAAIGVAQMSDDDTPTFWQLLLALLALMVVMMILTHFPRMARLTVAWVLTACFSFWAITATGQAITFNSCPRLATATCILSLHMAASCDISRPKATDAVAGSAETDPGTAFAQGLVLRNIVFLQSSEERVFIQFAGYGRDRIVALAQALAAKGWTIEGADRGGERIAAAAGLNEIRFFNPADADRATALAEAMVATGSTAAPKVVDLSASQYGKTTPGLLEIWVSE